MSKNILDLKAGDIIIGEITVVLTAPFAPYDTFFKINGTVNGDSAYIEFGSTVQRPDKNYLGIVVNNTSVSSILIDKSELEVTLPLNTEYPFEITGITTDYETMLQNYPVTIGGTPGLYYLLTGIYRVLKTVSKKIKLLDDYWSKENVLTTSTSSVASGYKVISTSASIVNNTLFLHIEWQTTSAISSGTSVKKKLCVLTLSGLNGITPLVGITTANGINGGTGPIITGNFSNVVRTDDDTATMEVWIAGTAGGSAAANTTFTFRFLGTCVRDMTVPE